MTSRPLSTSTISISEYNEKATWVIDLVDAGFPLIAAAPGTKHPITSNWQHTQPDLSQSVADFPGNYCVVLQSRSGVLDVDPKSYADGDDPFVRLKDALGMQPGETFDTYTVRSRKYPDGREGLHVYFSIPEGYNLGLHAQVYGKGLALLSTGCQVVGPGSINPSTGKRYEVIQGHPAELMPVPGHILDAFALGNYTQSPGLPDYVSDEDSVSRFRDWLLTAPLAVEKAGGEPTTHMTAKKGHDFGLTAEMTYELMLTHWNDRCSPPWEPVHLFKKVQSAYKSAKDSIGNANPAAAFEPFTPDLVPPEAEELSELARSVERTRAVRVEMETAANIHWDGTFDPSSKRYTHFKNTLNNVKNYFLIPDHPDAPNPFYKMIRENTFSGNIEIVRPTLWARSDADGLWSDNDTVQLRAWFSRSRSWNPSEKNIIDAVISYASDNRYHPVKQYFSTLKWDGVARLDNLFTYYAGAADTEYHRAVGRCFMIAMVARIMQPGIQHDHVVILEGEQGTGKSSFCRILGGDFYAAVSIDPHNKDTVQGISGKMLVEIEEMVCLRRADADALKAFISRTADTIRLPYGRLSRTIPRACVFIGTVNPEGGYLPDKTGNRRSWPVKTSIIRLSELGHARDQLFAEALDAWKGGERHYLKGELEEMAKVEQAQRTEFDVWAEVLLKWLGKERMEGRLHPRLTSHYILNEVFNIPAAQITATNTRRLASLMQALGWDRKQFRMDGQVVRGYENPYTKEESEAEDDLDDLLRGV